MMKVGIALCSDNAFGQNSRLKLICEFLGNQRKSCQFNLQRKIFFTPLFCVQLNITLALYVINDC